MKQYDKIICPLCKGDGIERKYRVIYEAQRVYMKLKYKNIEYYKCFKCNGRGEIYWIDSIIPKKYKHIYTKNNLKIIYQTCEWILYNKPCKDKYNDYIDTPYISDESIDEMNNLVSDLLDDEIILGTDFLYPLYENISEYEYEKEQEEEEQVEDQIEE